MRFPAWAVALAFGALASDPGPAACRQSAGSTAESPTPRTFRWGIQRPDLVRYNRVEAFSLGARGQIRPESPFGSLSVTGTARLGVADRKPNLRVDVTRETLRRAVTWSAFTELAAVEEDARHLALANSFTALLLGRDDGDYYRRAGTSLEWTPPSAERRSFRVRAFAQYEWVAKVGTDFALPHVTDSTWTFREGLRADKGWTLGSEVTLAPWWGTDPQSAEGGVEWTVRAAGGDRRYVRTSLVGRTALPLPARLRLGVEAGAGAGWGDLPRQRRWAVGGTTALRGYAPRTQVGTAFGRARAEIARTYPFGAVSLFGDGGWAGKRKRVHLDEGLVSAGVGLSLVDGLVRLDGAWGLRAPRDFRLDFYLGSMR